VNWDGGIIERKRSKTEGHAATPVVRYKLWRQTFDLLKQWRSGDPEIVLLTGRGKRWIQEKAREGGRWQRSDSIASCLNKQMAKAGIACPVKSLRATAATKLGTHPAYKFYTQYFLGHSPRGVAEKHYVIPNDVEFFAALGWLEQALALTPEQ